MNLKEVQRFVYKGGRLKRPSGCPEDMYVNHRAIRVRG